MVFVAGEYSVQIKGTRARWSYTLADSIHGLVHVRRVLAGGTDGFCGQTSHGRTADPGKNHLPAPFPHHDLDLCAGSNLHTAHIQDGRRSPGQKGSLGGCDFF